MDSERRSANDRSSLLDASGSVRGTCWRRGLGALVILATTGALGAAARNPAAARDAPPAYASAHSAHPENPPPAYTGGFGEPTCAECHFDRDVNAGSGTLALEGLPERIGSGTTHRLTVRITHPDMRVAGFMLSVRTAAGAQAGTLSAADERTTITVADDVAYAHHTREGTRVAAKGESASWIVEWDATGVSAGDSVVFHLVGNAGNDDESPFGDFIYAATQEIVVE